MTESGGGPRDELLRRAAVLGDGADPEAVLRFLTRYYRHVVTEDLLQRVEGDLLGMALSHRSLALDRMVGTANVRVFTPSIEQDGWATGHTIIEVVTDDMPFLVDSISAELARQERVIHLLVHPQLLVRRNAYGALEEVIDADVLDSRVGLEYGVGVESWLHFEIDRESDSREHERIAARLRRVLEDVRVTVEDWPRMTVQARTIAAGLRESPPVGVEPADVEKVTSLLDWLADGQFTFLGYREYRLDPDGQDNLHVVPGTGLGLLRHDDPVGRSSTRLSGVIATKARERELLIITKANSLSTIHRPVHLDYIGVKVFGPDGSVTGERRFVGLFTASAYNWSVTKIPYLREKADQVLEQSGFDPHSHLGKDLLGVLETYPRDELFQTSVETLLPIAKAVVHLNERRQTRLFLRRDVYGRFMSCLIYLPRDRYTTAVRLRIEAVLRRALESTDVEYTTRVSDSLLARLHYVFRVPHGCSIPEVDVEDLQRQVVEATRTWGEDFNDSARTEYGEEHAGQLLTLYGGAFPEAFKEDFPARIAVADLRHIEELTGLGDLRLNLYKVPGGAPGERRLKVYRQGALSLSALLPVFTDLGVEVTDERPYELKRADGTRLHIYDFGLKAAAETIWSADHDGTRTRFHDAFEAVWTRAAESDGFNGLVLNAGLSWRQVVILRAIARYLRQTGITFSNAYLVTALTANPAIAKCLVELFDVRLRPDGPSGLAVDDARIAAEREAVATIESALEGVASLDQDRLIRAFLAVILAVERTNYYQRARGSEGEHSSYRPTVALKLDPHRVPNLPQPRPAHEVWIYSPRVEGVHLRFGKVARGGLRWSDRPEDFRTEVLGLVKAQTVKNVVTVPTGAKGGFFPKQLPDPAADREAWLAEGVAAYRLYISSLLDVTDNLIAGRVQPPERVVRHDGDDTYLVVAADKGTAAFSDVANAVAQDYGYWLDDAFAAGGSVGYDHKKMGITAKGAWESVKRHFRELDRDVQTQDVTVVGIGDMSGDVFGNGMLCSEHIALVAAFDHRHIFLDPTPDPATSYAERRRLFDLPRSSWGDYDRSLLSAGGAIVPRSAKSVTVSAQARAALGMAAGETAMAPSELLRAILRAPVDLLWNGGIGTYVKAISESAADIGDRANDAIRVNGADLRVKVVGEGGNLGVSQLGRVEAALAGVRVNTDALDNSAGVDTSDHEVNIKILLGGLVRAGDMTLKQRNLLLASMTDDVAASVLRDNYEQNVLIGNARSQEIHLAQVHNRLVQSLSARGLLERAIEFLPTDAALHKRIAAGGGLTSPELAILIAYAKIALKAELASSGLCDDPWFARTLSAYFPPAVREPYAATIADHPLRSEIIVNEIANSVINSGGISFVFRAVEETGASAEQVARAFVVAREIFAMAPYRARCDALDNQVSTQTQGELDLEFRRLLDRATRWFLHNRATSIDVTAEIARFGTSVCRLAEAIPELLSDAVRDSVLEQASAFCEAGVPRDLALRAATLLDQYSCLDIVELATERGEDVAAVGGLYFAISQQFGIDPMLSLVSDLPRADRWDALARGAMRDDLYAALEALTRVVLESTDKGQDAATRLATWTEANTTILDRMHAAVQGINALEAPGLAPLSVVLRTLRGLVRAGSAPR